MPGPLAPLAPDQVDLDLLTLPDAQTIAARLAAYSNDPHQRQHLHPLFVSTFANRRLTPAGVINGLVVIAAGYTDPLVFPHANAVANLYYLAVPHYLQALVDDEHTLDQMRRLWVWYAQRLGVVHEPTDVPQDFGPLTIPDAETVIARLAEYHDDPYLHQRLFPLFVSTFAGRRLQPMDIVHGLVRIAADYCAAVGAGPQDDRIARVFYFAVPHYLRALVDDEHNLDRMRHLWLHTGWQIGIIPGGPETPVDGE